MPDHENNGGCGWICGVVEGFYGRPWTPDQRKELFRRMEIMGMNSYVYAPKDDLKHRAYWRDVYTVEEADHLQALIESAKKHNIIFYYALSPGLDIVYSMSKEISFLKQKLDQVKSLGCNAFALLFDDIEPTMSDADRQKFCSFAQAQVSVTTEVYEHLGEPAHFMFCPTEYCESRAVPTLEISEYLRYIGQKLPSGINILWTGPRVISRLLTVEHLTRVSKVLRRKPLIWDNLHANDYDNKRIFLGPYSGRPIATKENLAGVVTNPNCEFEANYLAMHTLGYWSRCESDAEFPAAEDAALEAGSVNEMVAKTVRKELEYHPVRAIQMALDDWLPEILTVKMAYGRTTSVKPQTELVVGINTCASVTSTTSSNSSLTSTTAGGPFAPIPGIFPLYTPPVVAEAIKNPFLPPPIIDPVSMAEDPVLTPAMQAVNSLTDEYSEPMEVAPSSASASVPLSVDNSPEKAAPGGLLLDGAKDQPGASLSDGVNTREQAAGSADEIMESRSIDNLAALPGNATLSQQQQPTLTQSGSEAMIVDVSSGQKDGVSEEPPAMGQANRTEKASDAALEEVQMQVDAGKDEGVEEDGGENYLPAPLTRDDIQLLAELFYLPFEHGPRAYWIIEEFLWLKANGGVMKTSRDTGSPEQAEEWMRRAMDFDHLCGNVTALCCRLVDCLNRRLVYDFYPYVWDLQGILNVLNGFIKWIEPGHKTLMECEPWIFRGGLIGEVQRLLPVENGQDLFLCRPPHPPSGRVFRTRPYCAQTDRDDVYVLCKSSILDDVGSDVCAGDEFVQFPELIGDWVAGSLLDLCPDYCFVVEDEHRDIVGFALAARDSVEYYRAAHEFYIPKMRSKYQRVAQTAGTTGDAMVVQDSFKPLALGEGMWPPKDMLAYFHHGSREAPFTTPHCVHSRHPSLLVIRLQATVLDTDAPKRLLAPVLASLKAIGSTGVHGWLRRSERNLCDLYCRLGFFEIGMLGEEQAESEFLGRLL